MSNEKVCLACELPICDDRSKECAFMQIERETARERVARTYKAAPQKKIAKVRQWQKDNRERLNAYQRERYARLKGGDKNANDSRLVR
jgi:hypothetical protein